MFLIKIFLRAWDYNWFHRNFARWIFLDPIRLTKSESLKVGPRNHNSYKHPRWCSIKHTKLGELLFFLGFLSVLCYLCDKLQEFRNRVYFYVFVLMYYLLIRRITFLAVYCCCFLKILIYQVPKCVPVRKFSEVDRLALCVSK